MKRKMNVRKRRTKIVVWQYLHSAQYGIYIHTNLFLLFFFLLKIMNTICLVLLLLLLQTFYSHYFGQNEEKNANPCFIHCSGKYWKQFRFGQYTMSMVYVYIIILALRMEEKKNLRTRWTKFKEEKVPENDILVSRRHNKRILYGRLCQCALAEKWKKR